MDKSLDNSENDKTSRESTSNNCSNNNIFDNITNKKTNTDNSIYNTNTDNSFFNKNKNKLEKNTIETTPLAKPKQKKAAKIDNITDKKKTAKSPTPLNNTTVTKHLPQKLRSKTPNFITNKFNSLSKNMLSYLIQFCSIKDLLQLVIITNKKLLSVIKQTNKTLPALINLLSNENTKPGNLSLLNNNAALIESLKESPLCKDLLQSEFDDIIQTILFRIAKGRELNMSHASDKSLYYLNLLLNKKESFIETLKIGSFEQKNVEILSKIIANNKSIKNFKLDILILRENFYLIWDNLMKNKTISEIHLKGDKETNYHNSLNYLFVALALSKNINKIFICKFYFNSELFNSLKNVFTENDALREFHFIDCCFQNTLRWERVITLSKSLEVLEISDMPLEKTELKGMTKAYEPTNNNNNNTITYTSSISRLILHNNQLISHKCGEYLGQFINTNKSLIDLDISNNNWTIKKFALFCEHLKNNNSLKVLQLRQIGLDKTCSSYSLTEALKVNKSLVKLDVSENNIRSYSVFTNILNNCKTLQELIAKGNPCFLEEPQHLENIERILGEREKLYLI